ncbi:hypothetical protein [Patulibacter minatonensis]|uniref:hypothetical protein n=1 Tax=Patulibacter minatonensis TaxID=298163 RepID=UPI0004BAE357|nr:hypothetical protein [Patulibacter minatonensis]
MIVFVSRAVTRVVAFVALPVLAVVAVLVAVAATVGENQSRKLADQSGLTDAWREVGPFLDRTAPSGDTAAVLAAIGAVLLGIVLLIGALAPSREREVPLADGADLRIRRRALRGALQSLTGRVLGTTGAKVRLRPRRRRAGGRLVVQVTRTPRADPDAIRATLDERLGPLAGAFALRTKVRTAVGRSRRARTE